MYIISINELVACKDSYHRKVGHCTFERKKKENDMSYDQGCYIAHMIRF